MSPVSKYVVQVKLSKPDASLFGWFAWNRWSAIGPNGLYSQINPVTQGIGTGPFKLVEYVPNDHVTYRNGGSSEEGAPIPRWVDAEGHPGRADRDRRASGRRTRRRDRLRRERTGAERQPEVTVLKGQTAGFYELQFTVKAGQNQPWADKRVRQAINMAINRDDLIQKVLAGPGAVLRPRAARLRTVAASAGHLKSKYQKYNLEAAQALMKEAGFSSGFPATMHVVGTVATFTQIAQLLQSYVKQIGIDLTLQAEDGATFSKAYAPAASTGC